MRSFLFFIHVYCVAMVLTSVDSPDAAVDQAFELTLTCILTSAKHIYNIVKCEENSSNIFLSSFSVGSIACPADSYPHSPTSTPVIFSNY